jgi:type VI secretion system protein ImpH
VEVNEFIGMWLVIEPGDRLKLGGAGSGLGRDAIIGSSTYSIGDKFRIEIFAKDLDEFERFLPSGQLCDRLADIVFFYLGDLVAYDVQLSLPKRAVRPARLASFGRLGWTSWMVSPPDPAEPGTRSDARFHPAEQARLKRKKSPTKKA